MKTSIKESVKRQIWRMGYTAKEMIGIPGISYDLLVDGKIRLAIFNGNKDVDCDMFASIRKGEKEYAVKSDKLVWKKFTKTFGQKRAKK